MLPLPAGREASESVAAPRYERHHPERTLLYQLVEEHYPVLKAHLAAQGSTLPGYVERELDRAMSMWKGNGVNSSDARNDRSSS